MLQETTKPSDDKGFFPFRIGLAMADQKARMQDEVGQLKVKAEEAFQDAVSEAKRMAKKGRHAAEDLVDDAEYKIKKAPFRSVGVTFAAGLGLGILAGFLAARLSDHCSAE